MDPMKRSQLYFRPEGAAFIFPPKVVFYFLKVNCWQNPKSSFLKDKSLLIRTDTINEICMDRIRIKFPENTEIL